MGNAKPQIFVKEIPDLVIRQNFQNLSDYFSAQNQLQDFQFFEQVFTGAASNQSIAHKLGVIPQDIVISRITGPGEVTFNYSAFTAQNIYLTASDACRVRFFVGTYWNFQSSQNNGSTDLESISGVSSGTQSASSSSAPAGSAFTLLPLTATQINSGAYPGSVATSYQVRSADYFIAANLTANAITANLPKASTVVGQTFIFFKNDSGGNALTVQVAAGSGDLINGDSNKTISTQYGALRLYSYGSGYYSY